MTRSSFVMLITYWAYDGMASELVLLLDCFEESIRLWIGLKTSQPKRTCSNKLLLTFPIFT